VGTPGRKRGTVYTLRPCGTAAPAFGCGQLFCSTILATCQTSTARVLHPRYLISMASCVLAGCLLRHLTAGRRHAFGVTHGSGGRCCGRGDVGAATDIQAHSFLRWFFLRASGGMNCCFSGGCLVFFAAFETWNALAALRWMSTSRIRCLRYFGLGLFYLHAAWFWHAGAATQHSGCFFPYRYPRFFRRYSPAAGGTVLLGH